MVRYYININNSFLTQLSQFQIENEQCFPIEKGYGKTVLLGSRCDVRSQVLREEPR